MNNSFINTKEIRTAYFAAGRPRNPIVEAFGGNSKYISTSGTNAERAHGGKGNDTFKIGDPSNSASVAYHIIAGSAFDLVVFKGGKWKKKTGSGKWEVSEHGPRTESHATFDVTGAFEVKIR